MSEHDEQVMVFNWAHSHEDKAPCLALMHSSLNGIPLPGSAVQKGKIINYMKAEGMLPGVPDIFLPYPNKGYVGLYIEMKKSEKEEPTEQQRWYMDNASNYGYCCNVAGGALHAVEILKEYLDIVCDCGACQLVEL